MTSLQLDATRASWVIVAAGLCGLLAVAQAASPTFWLVSTQEDFLLGEVENVSVDAMGQLQLGPDTEIIYETTAPFLWTAAQRNDVLWVGSGNDGKVYTVDASGLGTEVFDAKELNIHALAPASDGSAYVGASPDGAVYEVRVDATPPDTVFDPDERYIWALTIHPETGDVYVGTGEPGRIYRVQADGSATLHYDTEATHVLALSWDTDGNLLAGTGSPGRLFRIDDDGQGFVLLDSGFEELRSLRVADDGTIYAVAVSQSPARSETPSVTPSATPAAASGGTPTVTTTVTAVVVSGGASTSTASQSGAKAPASGAVYRIREDGVWDVLWESKTDAPYDIALSGDDDAGRHVVLVGTGPTGKIFRVTDDPPRVVLLTRAPAKQITGFVKTPDGGHYYVTANPGKVHRLSAVQAPTGNYVSDVRDAQTVATWGTVRWRATEPAGTAVRLFTRSGNTDKPNATWSPWSEPYEDPAGSLISSPKARYLQWKAELTGTDATPSLLSVTTAYLPANVRPQITKLTVHPPGVGFQQPFSGTDPPIAGLGADAEARAASNGANGESQPASLGRRVYRKGLQSFVWAARDDNADDLEFDLLYRFESGADWAVLTKGTRDSIFAWDTTSTPDGTYVVRVVATDALSNAPGTALAGVRDSAPFDIDNSPPRITLETARQAADETIIPFTVEDSQSPVQRVEYSTDTERWQIVYPIDGIPDSQVERFEITVNTDESARIVLRATDAMANTTTASGR